MFTIEKVEKRKKTILQALDKENISEKKRWMNWNHKIEDFWWHSRI